MEKLTIKILLLSCLLTVTLSATCGESAWVKAIEADLFSASSSDGQEGPQVSGDWSQFKANVESTDKRAIPDFCQGVVQDTDPTCCNTNVSVDYKQLINKAIRTNIRVATRGKMNNCKSAQQIVNKDIEKCVTEFVKNAIKNGNTGNLPSGLIPSGMMSGSGSGSGSASMSMSWSMSGGASMSMSMSFSMSGDSSNSQSGSSPSDKLKNQIKATLKLQEAKGMKIFADIASKIVPYVRGSVCLICAGSAQASADYWSGTGAYIKQSDYDAIIEEIAKAIFVTKELASGCKNDIVLGLQNMIELYTDITCTVSQEKLDAIENSVALCQDMDACQELAKTKFTSIFNFQVVSAFMGAPDSSDTSARRGLASTFQVDASKGVSPQPDPTEDATLEIGNQSVQSINSETTAAQTEVTAAGGEVNLEQAAAGNNTTLLCFTLLFALISCLIY